MKAAIRMTGRDAVLAELGSAKGPTAHYVGGITKDLLSVIGLLFKCAWWLCIGVAFIFGAYWFFGALSTAPAWLLPAYLLYRWSQPATQ